MESADRFVAAAEIRSRCQAIESHAEKLFNAGAAWTAFYRELFGKTGLVRRMFPSPQERYEFEQTPTYRRIQEMLAALRRAQEGQTSKSDEISVITLRIPKSLHDALIEEAHELKTSINRLCISKLAQLIDARLVPPLKHHARQSPETVWQTRVSSSSDEIEA